ncbi:hypothetical protein HanIR_Chr07g0338311 [Helianthus annuus]|nr:hypothetical protein HanIR_Chr07g0338311 [Helianthus annuus]
MRETASVRVSGREKAERSTSSDQGRRWEKEWRREEERREMKERRAGVAIDGVVVDWLLVTGSDGGGDDIVLRWFSG